MARSWAVSTFCDTWPMGFRWISVFHLSPMSMSVVFTGQAGNGLHVCHGDSLQWFPFGNYGTKRCLLDKWPLWYDDHPWERK